MVTWHRSIDGGHGMKQNGYSTMEISIQPSTHQEVLPKKLAYLAGLGDPLDGMWESGFMPMGSHYRLFNDGQEIGHCIVNAENRLLQFVTNDTTPATAAFQKCLGELKISGAFASTCEPKYLALCLDHQSAVQVNAIMYRESNFDSIDKSRLSGEYEFCEIEAGHLELAVQFAVDALGADPNWLASYYSERIKRRELLGVWQDGNLIGAGECLVSDTQIPFADLGMVVGKSHRKKGLATEILLRLRDRCRTFGLRGICSTESSNVAAQKAIVRAGFVDYHRIVGFDFVDAASAGGAK